MSKRILRLLVTLAAVATLGVGGVALSAATPARHLAGEPSGESTAPENSAADPDNVQYTAPGDADYTGTAAVRQSAHRTRAAHTRRHSSVQRPARRAQSTPEPGEQPGENESSVESEQGQPGEPVNGHEDAAGQNVNHECTGNCVE